MAVYDDFLKEMRGIIFTDTQPARFYCSLKYTSQDNPGRPIVSSNNALTEKSLQFVDYHLRPLVEVIPSYIVKTFSSIE